MLTCQYILGLLENCGVCCPTDTWEASQADRDSLVEGPCTRTVDVVLFTGLRFDEGR